MNYFGVLNDMKRIKQKEELKEDEKKEESKEEEIKEENNDENEPNSYECVVCLHDYEKKDILFPCKVSKNHHFCHTCFEDWKDSCCRIFKEVTCPICRAQIPKNGKYTYYYEDGTKRQEAEYLNDIPNGSVQIWFLNGNTYQKFYSKNNKYHGLFEEYDELGFLKRRVFYEDGTIHGLFEEYYPNEIIKVRCNYHKGFIQGTYQLFYNTSLLFLECECGPIGGKMNGLLQVWNEEGELVEKYQCKNGRINIMYDDDLNVSYSRKSGSFTPIPLE